MRILITNDDGCHAEGLQTLRRALAEVAEVVVVAPDRNRSGASNSLTLDRPLRIHRHEADMYCVDGTPTDSVHVAITGLLETDPDMVVSGINAGSNMGDDVLYSGTVAGATEGRFLGLPAIAVSLVGEEPVFFETAARVALELVGRLRRDPLPADTILNVNVPDRPWDELRGYAATRLGRRHRAERLTRSTDPRGRQVFWIGPAGQEADAGPGTDFHAVSAGMVSITPVHLDLTRYEALEKVAGWLGGRSQ
ncbi:MAG TPA: 5'/3'-nucleotidase SurE [Gammaproteobacteria bacterium]|nr:5'/3'-nucleotidase SurE [Gammaproteobacteria bacterium]